MLTPADWDNILRCFYRRGSCDSNASSLILGMQEKPCPEEFVDWQNIAVCAFIRGANSLNRGYVLREYEAVQTLFQLAESAAKRRRYLLDNPEYPYSYLLSSEERDTTLLKTKP